MANRPTLLKSLARAALALSILPLASFAQTSPSAASRAGEIGEQLEQERERVEQRERELRAPSARLESAEEPIPVTLPSESPCFTLRAIDLAVPGWLPPSARAFNDPTSLSDRFAFARRWLDRYVGQCAGQRGIELLRKGVLAQILARGYVTTRVSVPDQDLSTGSLRFELLPGTIHEIRFADPTVRGTWRSAFPSRSGDLLNLRDFEQGLEQMKRVPSQDIDMKIEPAKQVGQSDVVIAVQRTKPWKIALRADNAGMHETGKLQGSMTFALDNPLGLSDLFSAGLSNDLFFTQKTFGTHGKNAYYSAPWGNWTFSLSGYTNNYFQHVAGANQVFLSRGETGSVTMRADRTLCRDQFSKTSMQLQLSRRFGKSFIEDTEIGAQYRNNTFFEIGLARRQYFGAAQLDATLAYRQGVPWFGAQGDLYDPYDGVKLDQTYLYRMATIDAALSVPLRWGSVPLRYASTFRAQLTNDQLFYIDDISIGSFYSVRGFDGEYLLSAEKGFYWRNDLEFPLGDSGQSLYVGVDCGRVYGPTVAALLGNELMGAVIGVRGGKAGIAGAISYDCFIGAPVVKPSRYPTARTTAGFQLTYQY